MTQPELLSILDEAAVSVVSRRPNHAGWLACLCPLAEWLHERGRDTNPSFFVKVNPKGISSFHCFTCKQHGRTSSLMRLLQHYREEDMDDLIIRADLNDMRVALGDFEQEGEEVPEREELDMDVFANMYPLAWEVPECREYLQRRGVTSAASLTMGLKFDTREQRVLFPVMGRSGKLYGFSGRSILHPSAYPFPRYSKHRDYSFRKELCLLGEHLVQKGKPVLLVEGLFAYAHMISIGARGWCNPVASMGSSLSDFQRDLLIEIGEPVVLCYDNDHAGDEGLFGPWDRHVGAHKGGGAVDTLKKELPTKLALYPQGVDDPDDLTLQQLQRMLSVDHELCS